MEIISYYSYITPPPTATAIVTEVFWKALSLGPVESYRRSIHHFSIDNGRSTFIICSVLGLGLGLGLGGE